MMRLTRIFHGGRRRRRCRWRKFPSERVTTSGRRWWRAGRFVSATTTFLLPTAFTTAHVCFVGGRVLPRCKGWKVCNIARTDIIVVITTRHRFVFPASFFGITPTDRIIMFCVEEQTIGKESSSPLFDRRRWTRSSYQNFGIG